MRLSDVLSKSSKHEIQVDGFLIGKRDTTNQCVTLDVGQIALNYFYIKCDDMCAFFQIRRYHI